MSKLSFSKASKKAAKGRVALIGPSGSGKTFWALGIASRLGERVAVLDTEHGSASKYAGDPFAFEVVEPDDFSPKTYVDVIRMAEDDGFDVLVIDSLSHAWMGKGGALEQVDLAAKRSNSGNSFAGWREVTPQHNALVEAMITARLHVIVTMRTKTEYVIEENDRGKKAPRKIGLAPVQRDGLEYEFDVTADLDLESNNLIVGKTRCSALRQRVFQPSPTHREDAGLEFGNLLRDWLTDGAEQALSPVDDFMRRFRGCGTTEEVETLAKEVVALKDRLSSPELERLRQTMASARKRVAAATGAASSGSSTNGDNEAA